MSTTIQVSEELAKELSSRLLRGFVSGLKSTCRS